MPIRDWPEAIRPRERLIRDGPPALSDAQLLGLVIGSGSARRSALALAELRLDTEGMELATQNYEDGLVPAIFSFLGGYAVVFIPVLLILWVIFGFARLSRR